MTFYYNSLFTKADHHTTHPTVHMTTRLLPSYSVKPKFIDFIGFDDFIYLKNRAGSDGYRCIMYRTADKWV